MHKRIDVHIPEELYKEIKQQELGITQTVTQALTQYLHTPILENNLYNRDLVDQLRSENLFLRGEYQKLTSRAFLLPDSYENNNKAIPIIQESQTKNVNDNIPKIKKTPQNARKRPLKQNKDKMSKGKINNKKKGFWSRVFN